MAKTMLPVLTTFLVVGMAIVLAQLGQINYEVLLNDKAYVEAQLACVMGTKPEGCDKIGNRIRSLLPDNAKIGTCPQCNDQEKIYIVKVARLLKANYTKEWTQLLDLYKVDPKFRDTFLQDKA